MEATGKKPVGASVARAAPHFPFRLSISDLQLFFVFAFLSKMGFE